MKTNPNEFVTAIVSFMGGKSLVVQEQVIQDKRIRFILHIGDVIVEDYDDRFGCYYRQSDDGSQLYVAVKILESVANKDDLSIDVSAVTTPDYSIDKDVMMRVYQSDMCMEDKQFYMNVLGMYAMMYDYYAAHGDIAAAGNAYLDKGIGDRDAHEQAMMAAIQDAFDEIV